MPETVRPKRHPLADLIPESNQIPLLRGTGPAQRTLTLELAYSRPVQPFYGCFLRGVDQPESFRRIADYDRDEFFHDTDGPHLFSEVVGSIDDDLLDENEGQHVYSQCAFDAWRRDGQGPDWLFSIRQDSGNCVDASNVEMKAGLLGLRAMLPDFVATCANCEPRFELMRYLPAFWTYAWRGYCGAGWTMSACATQNKNHGWAPAIKWNDLDFDEENESERYVVSTWCRSGPPRDFYDWVNTEMQFRWDPAGITYFDGGLRELRKLVAAGGQFHHGSNTTSASSRPDTFTRIGGHAQTMFGGDWSERTIKFFADKGFRLHSADDFWVPNHQTWGSWSGETASTYWPTWWGPKPEGAWVVTASELLKRVDGVAYLPWLNGFLDPNPTPPEPPTPPTPEPLPMIPGILEGRRLPDGTYAVEGEIGPIPAGAVGGTYVARRLGDTRHRLIPKPDL